MNQTPFKVRYSNHKQEIKKKTGGLSQHYGDNAHCKRKEKEKIEGKREVKALQYG